MNELITLNGISPSKASADEIRKEIAQKVEEGELDPIKINASIKFFEKIFNGDDKKNNGLTHLIKDKVVSEIQKAPERTDYYGFKVKITEAGVKYLFENCGHPKLAELYEKQEELKKEIKEIEDLLKKIPTGKHITIVDEESGDMVKVFAPVRMSTTTPKFLLK
jgi:hypothetical protein